MGKGGRRERREKEREGDERMERGLSNTRPLHSQIVVC